MTSPAAELVIVSYARPATLLGTLREVRRLYPDLPICLGLQGDPPAGALAAEVESDRALRLEWRQAPSITRTLNACIRSSRADVVLLLDDDAIPCPRWLECHLAAFAGEPALPYTTGREVRLNRGRSALSEIVRLLVELPAGWLVGRRRLLNGRIVGWLTRLGVLFGNYDQPGRCEINSPRGCNMAIRRDLWLEAGGFSEAYVGNGWSFEAEFGQRLAGDGRFGRYLGDAVVLHAEVASGGSRASDPWRWFGEFVRNHRVLMQTLGPLGWLGSAPRLVVRLIQTLLKRVALGQPA